MLRHPVAILTSQIQRFGDYLVDLSVVVSALDVGVSLIVLQASVG